MEKKNTKLKKVFSGIWKFLSFQSVASILIIVILVGLFSLAQVLIGPSRIGEDLKAQMALTPDKIGRVEVDFGFKPEDYNIKTMQQFGSLGGVTDHGLYLMYISQEEIEAVSRIYWVKQITLAD